MSEKQKKAWHTGASDHASGFYGAIKICRKAANNGDANCAAYVAGFNHSGCGE